MAADSYHVQECGIRVPAAQKFRNLLIIQRQCPRMSNDCDWSVLAQIDFCAQGPRRSIIDFCARAPPLSSGRTLVACSFAMAAPLQETGDKWTIILQPKGTKGWYWWNMVTGEIRDRRPGNDRRTKWESEDLFALTKKCFPANASSGGASQHASSASSPEAPPHTGQCQHHNAKNTQRHPPPPPPLPDGGWPDDKDPDAIIVFAWWSAKCNSWRRLCEKYATTEHVRSGAHWEACARHTERLRSQAHWETCMRRQGKEGTRKKEFAMI